jgi:hypothetical protein
MKVSVHNMFTIIRAIFNDLSKALDVGKPLTKQANGTDLHFY